MPNFVTFKELQGKLVLLKIAAQAFEAGDFLNISLRFQDLRGSFSYKNFLIKNKKFSLIYPSYFDRLCGKMGFCSRNTQPSDQFYPISGGEFEMLKLSFYPKGLILTSKARVLRYFGSNGRCFRAVTFIFAHFH